MEEAGEQCCEEAERDEHTRERESNDARLALMEMWMGLPGYGIIRGRGGEGEAAAALSRLRKAFSVADDLAVSPLEGSSAEEGVEETALASALQVANPIFFPPKDGGLP